MAQNSMCKPKNPPATTVTASIMYHAHQSFGHKRKNAAWPPTEHSLQAFTDTCAQTCTSGPEILNLLWCSPSLFVPTSHGIPGIIDKALEIIGALLLFIRIGNHQTRQVVYVAKNIHGLYLSQTAIKEPGIIPQTFPNVTTTPSVNATTTKGPHTAPCGCPLCTAPLPHPEQLPLPPTMENRAKLETWILNHYASSAFNTCPHQPLQTITGKLMGITFRPDTTPSAVHSPIPIPHHWKKAMKEVLDRDVSLGIIEPVPQGTPTVWCSKMVVTPKKDGTPQRTVDLQKLN